MGLVFMIGRGATTVVVFLRNLKDFKKTFNSSLGPEKHHIINDIEVFWWTK